MATLSAKPDPYRALRYGNFRWLLFATTLTFIASQMQSLVLGWQVYEFTHDALALGWMGRVQAVNGFFIGSSNELGAFESGVAAKLLGLVPSVVFGGCMTLVVVAAVTYFVPELRKLKRITDTASE